MVSPRVRVGSACSQEQEREVVADGCAAKQSATTTEMARSLSEAARGATQIADSIRSVASVAERSEAGTSRTREAADELAQVSRALRGIVEHFTLT